VVGSSESGARGFAPAPATSNEQRESPAGERTRASTAATRTDDERTSTARENPPERASGAREKQTDRASGAREKQTDRASAAREKQTEPARTARESAAQTERSARGLILVAILVAFATLFLRLGGLALMDPDEGRNSTVASEMETSGSWLVPTYDGLDYLDKPSFFFKSVALSFAAFGRTETAARLPSALFAAATLVIAFFFARRELGARCAASAVIVVATTPLFLAFARIVIVDMTLCFFVCAALFAGYLAEEHEGAERRRWYFCGAAAAALATVVKGPVGFLLPALVLAIFALVERRPRAILRLLAPANLAVFLAIALTWFLALVRERPGFAYYGLVLETFKRFTTPMFHRTAPFYYYGPVILGTFVSWSLLFPETIAAVWRARTRLLRVERFLVVWTLVVVAFFSASQSKLPGYVLSTAVSLGILVARLFQRASGSSSPRALSVVMRGAVVLACLCGVLAALAGVELALPGTFERMLPRAHLEAWAPAFVPGFVAMVAVAALTLYARRTRRIGALFAAFVAMPLGVLAAGSGGFASYAESHSARLLARSIEAAAPGADVACLTTMPQGLPYYLGRTVALFTEFGGELSNYAQYTLAENPEWPPHIVRLGDRDRWLDERSVPIVLVARADEVGKFDAIVAQRGAKMIELEAPYRGALIAPANARDASNAPANERDALIAPRKGR
jgi:4-amino-4-deoxy-L-arabinose transferase-like glycosyltransferase